MNAQPPPLSRDFALPPLDMRLLAELPSLTLQANYMVEGFLAGMHRSPQKGSSVEFAEYRSYRAGDDLRRVDWRLFARNDRLHVKQYEDETQLRVFLVLDRSASMDFRSREGLLRKVEFARVLCAALARLAQRQGDAFGLGIVGDELEDFLRPRASTSHWRAFIGRLEAVKTGGPTRLASALDTLAELAPRRSMIVVASDFYEDVEPLRAALRRLRHDHHDLIGLHVLDPVEWDFDLEQSGTFLDAEDGSKLLLDAASVRKGYLERLRGFCAGLDSCFREAGGEVLPLRTDRPPIRALSEYVAKRKQKR